MNRIYLVGFLSLWLAYPASAQFEAVQYNYEKNWFGENEPLPAEKPWMITGTLPAGIEMVEVSLYGTKNTKKTPLYTADYRSPLDGETTRFSIPVNYNLRSNSEYTVVMRYFTRASDAEVLRLSQLVNNALESYLGMSVVAGHNRVDLAKNPRLIKQDLDQIMVDGLSLYRNTLGVEFDGFSELISDKLERIEDLKLRKARFNVLGNKDAEETKDQSKRVEYFNKNMDDLEGMLEREVHQYLSYNFYVMSISRKIDSYKSEQTRWVLPVNAGYAAVYNKGNLNNIDNISWDGSPYIGVSIPFANPNLSGKFWSNSSISAGVLINNLDFGTKDNGEDIVMTGPVIERPLYLAYGYKTAYFLRLQVGTSIMTEKNGGDKVEFSPFIGLSIELNLWLGLSR